MTDGQKYHLIRLGLEEYLKLNPLPSEFADDAIEWFLAHRKFHEAKALAKLIGRRVPKG